MNPLITQKLKQCRLNKNLKQSDVASILNVKSNTISNWENGKSSPDIDTLISLCKIYEISCTDLLEETYGNETVNDISINDIEKKIIIAYRNADLIGKTMVLRALNLESA